MTISNIIRAVRQFFCVFLIFNEVEGGEFPNRRALCLKTLSVSKGRNNNDADNVISFAFLV